MWVHNSVDVMVPPRTDRMHGHGLGFPATLFLSTVYGLYVPDLAQTLDTTLITFAILELQPWFK